MPAFLDITGTRVTIQFRMLNTATVRAVKEKIESLHGVPVARQTLRWGEEVLADDRTLASYDMGPDQAALISMAVKPNTTVPITVTLHALAYSHWRGKVTCMENTTVGQFKRLVADKLCWLTTGGMRLHVGAAIMTSLEGDDSRLLSEFLVMDGTVVFVVFVNGAVPPLGSYPVARL